MTKILENRVDQIKKVKSQKALYKYFVNNHETDPLFEDTYIQEHGVFVKKAREDIEEVKDALTDYFKSTYNYDLRKSSQKGVSLNEHSDSKVKSRMSNFSTAAKQIQSQRPMTSQEEIKGKRGMMTAFVTLSHEKERTLQEVSPTLSP